MIYCSKFIKSRKYSAFFLINKRFAYFSLSGMGKKHAKSRLAGLLGNNDMNVTILMKPRTDVVSPRHSKKHSLLA